MATSRIRFTFNEDLTASQTVNFRRKYNDGLLIGDWSLCTETWYNERLGPNQVSVGFPTATAGERSAINFATALGLDYFFQSPGNEAGSILRVGNVVTLSQTVYWQFDLESLPNVNPESVTIELLNYEGAIGSITGVSFLPATVNPKCTHYKISIESSVLITEYTLPNGTLVTGNTDNPLQFEAQRSQAFNSDMETAEGQTFELYYPAYLVPKIISAANFPIYTSSSPSGTTITVIDQIYTEVNIFEYSLNNLDWQTQSVFPGLTGGSYTVYIRDQFGCTVNNTVTISESGNIRTPYFRLSKSNSIRYANRVTWGDCGNYKTDENTLSCEADVPVPYKQILPFQTCDVITTQFESNYSTNTMTVVRSDGSEVSVPVSQVTNNRDLKDRRDARKYNLGNGKTGIYFTIGNIYDYDTGIDTGEDYSLLGDLPEWATISSYLKLDGAWLLIENTFFDETVNADVIVVSSSYTGEDVLVEVSAIYDLENFDEFEGTIDFVDYIDENVQVRINAIDPDFTNVTQLSEVINVKVRQHGTIEIRYKNRVNTDMNFSRGLENKIRVYCEKIDGVPVQENAEISKTDTMVNLLSGEVFEADKYTLSPVTKQRMRQIVLALSHSDVHIDGIPYVKNDSIEVEGALEETNLYDVSAVMIKSGNAFNSNSGQGGNTFNQENIELPGLIETDSGYVRY